MTSKAEKPKAVRQHRPGHNTNVTSMTRGTLPQPSPHHNRLTPRQRRALEALLVRPLTVADMRREAGVSNASDLVCGLNRRGFTIVSISLEVHDRDGKRCKTALYRLAESSRRKAEKALGA